MTENNNDRPHGATNLSAHGGKLLVVIVTSIHPDFDARIWKHAQLLAAAGHRVRLVCPWDVPYASVKNGVEFRPFAKAPSRLVRPIWNLVRLMPELMKVFKDADIVHFHDLDLLPWVTPLAFFKPVVYDVHENYAEEILVKKWIPSVLRKPIAFCVRWGQWLCSNIIRNIVLVAPSQEPDFSSSWLRKTYIYNYASKDLIASVSDDYADRQPTVVFVGSQHENNGSLLLLDIASRVAAKNSNIKFLAVDRFFDNSFRGRFLEERKNRGLDRVVQLVPNVKPHELMSILNQGTIGISPNLRVPQQVKGIHTKIFEYMAAGLPMVLSDLPHQLEVIHTSQAGIAVAPEKPQEFADAILDLAADKNRAREMGKRGREAFLANYCYESQRDELLSFYRRILVRAA